MGLDGKTGVHLDGCSDGGVSRLEVIEGPTGRQRRTKAVLDFLCDLLFDLAVPAQGAPDGDQLSVQITLAEQEQRMIAVFQFEPAPR